jgi:hypothetical protein
MQLRTAAVPPCALVFWPRSAAETGGGAGGGARRAKAVAAVLVPCALWRQQPSRGALLQPSLRGMCTRDMVYRTRSEPREADERERERQGTSHVQGVTVAPGAMSA